MEEKVLEILEEYCEEAIGYTGDNMMEEGVIDSFTVINIVSELEDAFDIEIDAKVCGGGELQKQRSDHRAGGTVGRRVARRMPEWRYFLRGGVYAVFVSQVFHRKTKDFSIAFG